MTIRIDRARGFTVVELFVVVGIISILIALLLPAVQSAREVARSVQCRNNLFQLGVALENYAASNRVYPPGVVNAEGPVTNDPVGYKFGWAARILPFLEQRNTYDRLNFTRGAFDDANVTASSNRINSFICPSSPFSASSNYVACHHDVEAPIDRDNHGVFFLNSKIGREALVDGPAFTIFLGETRLGATFGTWASGTAATLRNAGWGVNDERSPDVALQARGAAQAARAQQSFDPVVLQAMIDNGELAGEAVGGFSSHHNGGAHFLFGDGSVHHLKTRIDRSVLRALAHRSDGEIIDGEAY